MMKLKKLAKLFYKLAEKVYNCRYCNAPHSWVDPSGYICGQCGTTNYPNKEKKDLLKQKQEAKEPEIIKEIEPIKNNIKQNRNEQILENIKNEFCIPYIETDTLQYSTGIINIITGKLGGLSLMWDPKTIEEIRNDLPYTSKETAQKALDNARLAGTTVGEELQLNYLLHVDTDGQSKIRLISKEPIKIIDEFEVDSGELDACNDDEACIKLLNPPDWFAAFCNDKGETMNGMLRDLLWKK